MIDIHEIGEEGHSFKRLQAGIFKKSVSSIWAVARLEWRLDRICKLDHDDEPETCLCGHHPIMELCYIKNVDNGAEEFVGNVCINKFLKINTTLMHASLKRIRACVTNSLNQDAIDYFTSKNVFSPKEYRFLTENRLKRVLSGKQEDWRVALNKKALRHVDAPNVVILQRNRVLRTRS